MVRLACAAAIAAFAFASHVQSARSAEPANAANDEILDAYPLAEKRLTPHPLQDALKAAEAGDVFAQRYLAHALEYGRGEWKVVDEPAIWYRRAAERGAAFDIRELACFIYRNDENLPRRQRAAAAEMKRAADAGDVWASVYYSRFLRYGYGIKVDAKEADLYLERAIAALRTHSSGTIESEIWDELRERRCGPDDERAADLVLSRKR